jgi:hypothetical protein
MQVNLLSDLTQRISMLDVGFIEDLRWIPRKRA